MFSRRNILLGGLVAGGGLGVLALSGGIAQVFSTGAGLIGEADAAQVFAVTHTPEEWHAILNPAQYKVLREEGTERPYTSLLNDEHRDGSFACAGCDLALFSSSSKFDSHTGWPSFWTPLDNAVGVRDDRSFGVLRQEVHCSRCGGHLGHVFDDGPKPTGLRYCMNGLAMKFAPQAA
jgi:peptide-methionine (R)-S-oxide reductase